MTTEASEAPATVDAREYVEDWTVAERTGMSICWVRRARRLGGGPPFVKFGRACRYPVAELERWLDSRKLSRTGVPASTARGA